MTVSSRASKAPSITALEGEAIFVGLDVHKSSWDVAIVSPRRGVITHWHQPPRPALLIERLEPVRAHLAWVVHEAGPTGFGLVRALRENALPADVIAPSKTPLLVGEAKCDRLDAQRLAIFGAQGLLAPIAVPTPQQEADRELVRTRGRASRDLRRAKQRLRSFLLRHGLEQPVSFSRREVAALTSRPIDPALRLCLDPMLTELGDVQRRLKDLDRAVAALAQCERHAAPVQRLCAMPGISTLTAMVFVTELFSPGRFERGEQVAQFVGLAPRIRASGQSRPVGRLSRAGNTRLRTILIEAAWRWVSRDEAARRRFERQCGRSGRKTKAIVAMARRLALVMWRLSVSETPYEPR